MREEPPYFMSMVDLQEPSVNHLQNVFFFFFFKFEGSCKCAEGCFGKKNILKESFI